MKNKGESTIIVGHDVRLTSEELNKSLIEGIISTGMNVIDIGYCVTPMTYFAREYLKIKPSIAYTTFSHLIGNKRNRYRLLYLFENEINDIKLYNRRYI